MLTSAGWLPLAGEKNYQENLILNIFVAKPSPPVALQLREAPARDCGGRRGSRSACATTCKRRTCVPSGSGGTGNSKATASALSRPTVHQTAPWRTGSPEVAAKSVLNASGPATMQRDSRKERAAGTSPWRSGPTLRLKHSCTQRQLGTPLGQSFLLSRPFIPSPALTSARRRLRYRLW